MNKYMQRFARLRDDAAAGSDGAGGQGAAGGAGDQPPAWLNSIPEDIRGDASFKTVKAKDANEALAAIGRMHVNAQKMLGRPVLAKPQDNWTPEQHKAFFKELGVPDTLDKYTTPEFKFNEGLAIVPEQLEGWKKTFQEVGILPKQAEAIMKKYFEEVNGEHTAKGQASAQTAEANKAELRGEFGDAYEAKIDIANTALRNFADEKFIDFVEQNGLAGDPSLVKFLVKIGEQTMEDRAGGDGPGNIGTGPGAALTTIGELKIDKEFQTALNTRTHAGHKAAVDRWTKLHQQAFPTPKQS